MNVGSLRLRLLLLSAASLIVVLIVAGIAFATTFAGHTQRVLEDHLLAELNRVVALVDAEAEEPGLRRPMPDARYETPAGGIYWQVRDPSTGKLSRSRSLWDVALDGLPLQPGGDTASHEARGPDGQHVLTLGQSLAFERQDGSDRQLEIVVAEDLADVDAANAAFQSDLVRSLAVLALVLMATSWATIELGLAPLRRIKQGIARIRSDGAKTLAGDYPSEVLPLVSEVNELLQVQETSIEFARERAADLAHGLKTSLTLLNGEAFELEKAGNLASARRIEQLTGAMSETIDHQLRLSRLRHRVRGDLQSTPLADTARKVVAAVKATPAGRQLSWDIELDEQLSVAIDAMDLSELLGVVLENGAEWAKSRVTLDCTRSGDRLALRIADDGPGLDEGALATIGRRGRRLDEQRPGTGLGLAIAREIVSLNSGTLGFSRSTLGGLAVSIDLPLAR